MVIEVVMKTRQLTAKWTVELEQGEPEFGETVLEDLARDYQDQIDWYITSDLLADIGWQKVILCDPTMERFSHPHVWLGEVKPWLESNIRGLYRSRDRTWLFQDSRDAALFILRWL